MLKKILRNKKKLFHKGPMNSEIKGLTFPKIVSGHILD